MNRHMTTAYSNEIDSQNLKDPDPGSGSEIRDPDPGSGSGLKQTGSETHKDFKTKLNIQKIVVLQDLSQSRSYFSGNS